MTDTRRINLTNTILLNIQQKVNHLIENVKQCHETLTNETYYTSDSLFNTPCTVKSDILVESIHDNKFKISGMTALGKTVSFSFTIPSYLINNAPNAKDDDYPLNLSKTDFSLERKYDYLRTVNYASTQRLSNEVTKQVYDQLITAYTYQSRFGDPFRNLLSVIETLKVLDKVPSLLYYIINKLFYFGGKPRFHFSRQILQVEDNQLPSINPILLYTILNLLVAVCADVLSETDFYFCLQCHLIFAEDSLFDTRLKVKSAMRNFIPEFLHKFQQVVVPEFNDTLVAHGLRIKNTRENEIGLKGIETARSDRDKKIPPFILDIMRSYFNHITDIDKLRSCLLIMRYASNGGEYIRTLTELGLEKAVAPNTRGQAVNVAVPKKTIISQNDKELDGFPILSTYEPSVPIANDQILETIISGNCRDINLLTERFYFRPLIKPIASRLSDINMDSEWLRFVTVKSAGYIPPESSESLSPLLRKLNSKRIGHLAITAEQYRDMNVYLEDLSSMVKLNERQQIDRRQRAVVGTSNQMLINALPGYLAEKLVYDFSPSANQGKQRGNCIDLYKLLYLSTWDDMTISSMDISGMDSSIQLALQDRMNVFLSAVLFLMNELQTKKNKTYAAYNEIEVLTQENGLQSVEHLGGPFQAFVRDVRSSKQATTYLSKIFHTIKLSPGTFSSGRPDTGSHHTLQLDSIFHSQKWAKFSCAMPSYGYGSQIMGDDIIKYLKGPIDKTSREAEEDINLVASIGLKAVSETSTSGGTFLQQAAYCGRTFPFPDRIGLFTKERGNENPILEERMKELLALIDDLSSRVVSSVGLHFLAFFIGMFSCRRLVLKMPLTKIDGILKSLKPFPNIVCTVHGDAKESDTRLLSILLPAAWLFSHRGGNLPSFRFQRSDGTFTNHQFLTATRGFVQRRLLYDISNGILNGKLDVDWLQGYGFVDAEFVIRMEFTKLFLEAKLTPDVLVDISRLSETTNQILDLERYTKSVRAFGKLNSMGISIGEDIVYAYSVRNRLIEVVKNLRSDDEVLMDVSRLISVKIVSLIRKFNITASKESARKQGYLMIMSHGDDFKLQYLVRGLVLNGMYGYVGPHPYSHVIDHVALGPSLKSPNPSHMLFKLIGPANVETSFNLESTRVRGKFTHFTVGDPVYEQGLQFYKSYPSEMSIFFDAVGVFSTSVRNQYLGAFQYSLQERLPTLDFDLNPRRYYWNSTDFKRLNRYLARVVTVDGAVMSGSKVFLLANAYQFIEMASNPFAYSDFTYSEIIFGDNLKSRLVSM